METGSEIVASSNLYGGSYNLLNITFAKLGIKVHFVDPSDPNNFKRRLMIKQERFIFETISNPL